MKVQNLEVRHDVSCDHDCHLKIKYHHDFEFLWRLHLMNKEQNHWKARMLWGFRDKRKVKWDCGIIVGSLASERHGSVPRQRI